MVDGLKSITQYADGLLLVSRVLLIVFMLQHILLRRVKLRRPSVFTLTRRVWCPWKDGLLPMMPCAVYCPLSGRLGTRQFVEGIHR